MTEELTTSREVELKLALRRAKSDELLARSRKREVERTFVKEFSPVQLGDKVLIIRANGKKVKALCNNVHIENNEFLFEFIDVKRDWKKRIVHRRVNYYPKEDKIEVVRT